MDTLGIYEKGLYRKPYVTIEQSSSFPIHCHSYIEFINMIDGSIEVQLSERTIRLCKGDTMLISPFEVHGYTNANQEDAVLFKALAEPESLGVLGDILKRNEPIRSVLSPKEMKSTCKELSEGLYNVRNSLSDYNSPAEYMKGYSRLCGLISDFIHGSGLEKSRHNENDVLIQALQACSDNISDEHLNIKFIAEKTHSSTSNIQQLFSKNLNMGVKKYISLLRLNQAECLLRFTDISVLDIALNCGYTNVSTFNRAFSKVHNMSPIGYRRSEKPNSEGREEN